MQNPHITLVTLSRTSRNLCLNLTSLLLLLLSIGCSISGDHHPEPASTPAPTSVPGPLTFTGTWDGAEYGLLIMTQEGNNVFGAYEYPDNFGVSHYGYIKGVVEGDTLNYQWWQSSTPGIAYEEAEERGDGYFILGQDETSIQGPWRSEGDSEWADDWNLVRK